MWIDAGTLNPLMKKQYTQKQIDDLVEMSNADSRFELYDIGAKDAAAAVKEEHFPISLKYKTSCNPSVL